jgi:hypothetical protein
MNVIKLFMDTIHEHCFYQQLVYGAIARTDPGTDVSSLLCFMCCRNFIALWMMVCQAPKRPDTENSVKGRGNVSGSWSFISLQDPYYCEKSGIPKLGLRKIDHAWRRR